MPDQAQDLRRLPLADVPTASARSAMRPILLAVAGGKGGVGTTAAAWDMAQSFQRAGIKTLWIDADPRGGDAAMHCGIEERYALSDWLTDRRRFDEVAEAAPCGVRLIAGACWSEELPDGMNPADRLIERLGASGVGADLAIVDVGNCPNRAAQRISRSADGLVIVANSDPRAIVGAYTAVKVLTRRGCPRVQAEPKAGCRPLGVFLKVSGTLNVQEKRRTQDRLHRACHRLLGIDLAEENALPSFIQWMRECRKVSLQPEKKE